MMKLEGMHAKCMHRLSPGHSRTSSGPARPFFPHKAKQAPHRRLKPSFIRAAAVPAYPTAVLPSHELSRLLSSAGTPILADFSNPLSALHFQTPPFFSALSYLLANPVVTLGLAVVAYITIPRLWRAFLRFVVLPAALIGTAFLVVKNPTAFSNAGSFFTRFISDHPYAASAVILIGITLVLSPYLLTILLVLFLVTGIPRLPGPIRNILPGPVREFEQQFTNFDASVRGPIDSIKGAILGSGSESPSTSSQPADLAPVEGGTMSGIRRLGSGISSAGSQFWSSASEKGGLFDGIRDQASRLGSGASYGGAQLLESAAGRISQLQGGQEAPR